MVFSCVVYYRLKAFGKNGKIKLKEKIAILQYVYHMRKDDVSSMILYFHLARNSQ